TKANLHQISMSPRQSTPNENDRLSMFWDRSDQFFDPVLFPDSRLEVDQTPSSVELFVELWLQTDRKDYNCHDLRHLGADGKPGSDGAWSTCFDVFNSKPKEEPCRIFSFGINHDFTFEDRVSYITK